MTELSRMADVCVVALRNFNKRLDNFKKDMKNRYEKVGNSLFITGNYTN